MPVKKPRCRTPDINRILARPAYKAYSIRGADMGRRNQIDGKPEKLYLQRLKLFDGSCYDAGGAYWGSGPPGLWCAFSSDDTAGGPPTMVFARAVSRDDAKSKVLAVLGPDAGWKFF